MPKTKLTLEEKEAAKQAKREAEREAIKARLADVIASKHVHTPTGTSTITLKKELVGRTQSRFWRCNCGAAFDGEYWYKREEE